MKTTMLLLISALTASVGLLCGSQSKVVIPVELPIEGTNPAKLFKGKQLTLEDVDRFVKEKLNSEGKKNTNSYLKLTADSQEAHRLEEEADKTNIPSNEIENSYAYILFLAQCNKHFYYKPAVINKPLDRAKSLINAHRAESGVADLEDKALKLGLIQQKETEQKKQQALGKKDEATKMEPEINKTRVRPQSTAHLLKVFCWVGGGLALAATAGAVWYFGFHNKKAAPQAKKGA